MVAAAIGRQCASGRVVHQTCMKRNALPVQIQPQRPEASSHCTGPLVSGQGYACSPSVLSATVATSAGSGEASGLGGAGLLSPASLDSATEATCGRRILGAGAAELPLLLLPLPLRQLPIAVLARAGARWRGVAQHGQNGAWFARCATARRLHGLTSTGLGTSFSVEAGPATNTTSALAAGASGAAGAASSAPKLPTAPSAVTATCGHHKQTLTAGPELGPLLPRPHRRELACACIARHGPCTTAAHRTCAAVPTFSGTAATSSGAACWALSARAAELAAGAGAGASVAAATVSCWTATSSASAAPASGQNLGNSH